MTPLEKQAIQSSVAFLSEQPEYRDLVGRIGEVSVSVQNLPSKACSLLDSDAVILDRSRLDMEINGLYPKLIASLFFEMCNLTQKERVYDLIRQAKEGEISPNQFVDFIERVEYESLIKTEQFICKHFSLEIASKVGEFRVYPIHQHLLLQDLMNHSQQIWERHKTYFPKGVVYQTIWNPPVETPKEKVFVNALWSLVVHSQDPDSSLAKKASETLAAREAQFKRESSNGNALSGKLVAWLNQLRKE